MKLDLMSKIPSLQDLASAAATFQIGKPSVIYPQGGGQIILTPIDGRTPRIDARSYNELVEKTMETNDLEVLVSGLRNMGIEMSGKSDGQTVGKISDPKLQSAAQQFGSTIPRQGSKEIGGVSALTTGGKRASDEASKRYTGTPENVEIEIEYDPDEALADTDKTFVYHTHPTTNNNYR